MRSTLALSLLLAALSLAPSARADDAKPAEAKAAPAKAAAPKTTAATELTWYGNAAFKIVTPKGHILFVDPWLQNPLNKTGKEDLAGITKGDLILITHGHFDHVGDAAAIAKATGAKLVTTFDLGNALVAHGGIPKEQFGFDTTGYFGGEISLLDGDVKVAFIPAVHAADLTGTDGVTYPGGAAGGFVISIANGPRIYHTGDTDFFSDMALVKKFGAVDVMLACIGDRFTMGPKRAALAVNAVQPKQVIPMHFATFPVLTGTVPDFAKELKAAGSKAKLHELKIGETVKL